MSGFDYFNDVLFNKYAQFEGRSRRSEYWYFVLFSAILSWCLMAIDYTAGLDFGSGNWGVLGAIYGLALLIPRLAVIVRRLHDVGKSGWFLLINLIPIIGQIWMIVLLVSDSDYGDNEYGPNPKGLGSSVDEDLVIQDNLV